MAEARYTIGEAVSLLDVDRVTLKRWMDVENMVPQTDPRDKRIKYLTREQILELARLHGKIVRDETSIGPRLTGVQRDMLARIQHVEEKAAQLEAENARLRRALHLPEPREPRENAPTPLGIAEAPAPSESPYRAPVTYYGERLRPGEWETLPPIPDGWITPRSFAAVIGVPARTFLHTLKPRYDGDRERRYGTLDYHAGRWRGAWPGTFATELLDPEQQEAARAWFATRGQ